MPGKFAPTWERGEWDLRCFC